MASCVDDCFSLHKGLVLRTASGPRTAHYGVAIDGALTVYSAMIFQHPRALGRRASPEHSFLAQTNFDLEGRARQNPGHPIPGWGRLPPPAFGQHSGQGSDDLQLNTHWVSEGNERYTGTRVAHVHVE